ncbi:MAG: DUF1559 domain-containing protein, partial [Planctomycetes bacterium]|nr:DUF1559 domain-containing protein [Planctomycetota bacterium]
QNLHGLYPPGTSDDQGPVRSVAKGYHHNWLVQILPFLEERNAWRAVDSSVSVYHPNNARVAGMRLTLLQCPSQVSTPTPQSCYAGMHHDTEAPIDVTNNGVFFLNSRVRYEDVTDGSSHTIFLGEMFAEAGGLGWMSGTRATLRNTGIPLDMTPLNARGATAEQSVNYIATEVKRSDPQMKIDAPLLVGGFGSPHPGGAQFAFGDGHARFLSQSLDLAVFRQLAHRSDGKLLDDP